MWRGWDPRGLTRREVVPRDPEDPKIMIKAARTPRRRKAGIIESKMSLCVAMGLFICGASFSTVVAALCLQLKESE